MCPNERGGLVMVHKNEQRPGPVALALIAALSRVKLTEPIGKFNREELYDRHKGKWE